MFNAIVVVVEREGTSAEADLLVKKGDASLTLKRLKVSDEGTYICTVGSGEFQTQQVVQLHITRESYVNNWSLYTNDSQITSMFLH